MGISEQIVYQNTSYSYNGTYCIKVYGDTSSDYSASANYVVRASW